jgi:peptidoglycan/xylan/chitin deacetylase (PgdA/CDA1 family)
MYHRVLPRELAPKTFSIASITVTPETFARHLDWLGKHTHVMDLPGFSDWLHASRDSERPSGPISLITFDDGWWDNIDYALPALQAAGRSAVFFLATDYIGTDKVFWQERLGFLLGEIARRDDQAAETLLADAGVKTPTPDRAQVITAVRALKAADTAFVDALEERARSLMTDGATHADTDRFMSWTQAAELREAGQYPESHGYSHTRMTRLTDDTLRRELIESREHIARETGHRPTTMAYPNGDHDPRVMAHVREAGYDLAFSTITGWVDRGHEPLAIPRINMDEAGTRTEALFLCRLLRLF